MNKFLKIAGIVVSLLGAGVTIIADNINEQKMKEEVKNEVNRQLSEQRES